MEQAIKRAIEGGLKEGEKWEFQRANTYWAIWKNGNGDLDTIAINNYLLDPLFWQALGKQQGWDYESERFYCPKCEDPIKTNWCNKKFCMECGGEMTAFTYRTKHWIEKWHHFIDHIAEGKGIDAFFNDLIK